MATNDQPPEAELETSVLKGDINAYIYSSSDNHCSLIIITKAAKGELKLIPAQPTLAIFVR